MLRTVKALFQGYRDVSIGLRDLNWTYQGLQLHRQLSSPRSEARYFLTALPTSRELASTTTVNLTRAGTFSDPRYGSFAITPQMLQQMVSNFNNRVLGQDVFVDVAHKPEEGAAAKILALRVEGDRLLADVEWTPYGLRAVQDRGYSYLSAEYHEAWTDNEQGQAHGAVLLGAGLTTRPVIKRLDPVRLSLPYTHNRPAYADPDLVRTLSQQGHDSMNEYLKKLREHLEGKKLSQARINQIITLATQSMQAVGEDTDALQKLLEGFKQLAEVGSAPPAPTPNNAPPADPAPRQLSEGDILKLIEDREAKRLAEQRQQAVSLETHQKLFRKLLAEAKGLDSLPEDTRQLLAQAETLIQHDWTEAQVRSLAQQQIQVGDQMAIARNLSQMGYPAPAGSVQIQAGQDTGARRLQELLHQGLRQSTQHQIGTLRLQEDKDLPPFVRRVLAEFDRQHAPQIDREVRMLAGESTGMVDSALPVGFQREVIREALSDLNILQVVQTLTDPNAQATTQIPYEQRDTSAVLNDGVVFEGQGIPGASIKQMMDTAYIVPMKLAMKISNEVMHFSQASPINWDAYARNVESNSRVMRELVARRIANELQRASDAYGAVAVTGESIAGQLDGATVNTIKTANFPIVRPKQVYDLQGNPVGSETHSIAVALNGVTINRYDGSGTQAPGTYWRVVSYNLGYIQFVDETGAAVIPAETATGTVGYSRVTNITTFDLDVPGGSTLEQHLNGLLQKIGARKALMSGERFVLPDFMLMNPTLNDTISNAENFTSAARRADAQINQSGDLLGVKGIAAFGTNAPGIDLGEERILMGQRGVGTYTIAKPFMTGTPFEAVDSNGRPTGQKVAYGEEYNAIHVPAPIRERLTSVLVYSASGR